MDSGDILLRFAFLALLACAALSFPALRGRPARGVGWAFAAHAVAILGALGLLWSHFLNQRYEYAYVAQYSSRGLDPGLKLAASWAGQEGSILLWIGFAALLGVALARQPGALTRAAMFVFSLLQAALMVLVLVRSPFRRLAEIPADGQGLNPLLEDPWMIAHPPALFLGYAAFAVPFALGIAALARQDYREWNRMAWPWTLFGVVTLGIGIVLGGVWAYKVLGWGGYWGWDPVENASLIPWLVGVALLHGLLIQRTTRSLVRTNLALASLAWLTVLGGTYMTRSGVLQDFSVHSFSDTGLNTPLVGFLALSLLVPAVLLAVRWRALRATSVNWAGLSRESALWLGLVTVLLLAALVAFGTTTPLLTAIGGQPANVQPAFYTTVSLPMGIALVLLMALAPALRWTRQEGRSWLRGLAPGGVAGALALFIGLAAGVRTPSHLALLVTAAVALGVNAVVMARLFRRGWAYGGGYLGHVGIAVMIFGMLASGALSRSERVRLVQGEPGEALGYRIVLAGDQHTARGEHLLDIVLTSASGRELLMQPRLLELPRGGGQLRKPALANWNELYLAPLEVRSEMRRSREPVWLERGVEHVVDDVGYTFTGFRMESHENLLVYADVDVRRAGGTERVATGIRAGGEGPESIHATVEGLGEIHLSRIDADRGRVAVVLPAGGLAPAGVALVELSTKPLVNLVWVGALLTLLGAALSGVRRALERAGRGGAETPPRSTRSGPAASPGRKGEAHVA